MLTVLGTRAIEELEQIMSEENPKFSFKVYERKSTECLEVSPDSISSFVDCVICREFINITSKKLATSFTNVREGKDVDAKIVSLRRAKFIFV